jgi:protein-tyrosine phosphatase
MGASTSLRRCMVKGEVALHILFVCTGNICRSPTAERLAAAHAESLDIDQFSASSAGTRAVIGHAMHRNAVPVLQGLGGDPTNFVARQLTSKIVSSADLTLTMTAAHRDSVLEIAPHKFNRTFTLSEASRLVSTCGAETIVDLAPLRSQLSADERLDILDPIGQDIEFFARVGAQIADLLPPIIDLCRRSTTRAPK